MQGKLMSKEEYDLAQSLAASMFMTEKKGDKAALERIPAGVIYAYLNRYMPGARFQSKETYSPEQESVMNGFGWTDLVTAAGRYTGPSAKIVVSPFSVLNHLTQSGFSFEVQEAIVDKVMTRHILVTDDANAQIVARLEVIGGLINPVGLRGVGRFEVLPFSRAIGSLCASLATYFSLKNGKIAYQDPKSALNAFMYEGNGMTGSSHGDNAALFSLGMETIAPVLQVVFTSNPSPKGTWFNTTVGGMDFAHGVYTALCNRTEMTRKSLEFFSEHYKKLCATNQQGEMISWFTVKSTGIAIAPPQVIEIPTTIGDRKCNLNLKNGSPVECTVDQAHRSIMLSRTVLGVDNKNGSGVSRSCYTPVLLPPALSDLATAAAEMKPYTVYEEIVFKGEENHALYMQALRLLDYQGVVTVDINTPNISRLEKQGTDEHLRWLGAKGKGRLYVRVESLDSYLHESQPYGSRVVFLPRIETAQYSTSKATEHKNSFNSVVASRVKVAKTMKCDVVGRIEVYDTLNTVEGLIYTSARPHNGVLWWFFSENKDRMAALEKSVPSRYVTGLGAATPTPQDVINGVIAVANAFRTTSVFKCVSVSVLLRVTGWKAPVIDINVLRSVDVKTIQAGKVVLQEGNEMFHDDISELMLIDAEYEKSRRNRQDQAAAVIALQTLPAASSSTGTPPVPARGTPPVAPRSSVVMMEDADNWFMDGGESGSEKQSG